MSENKKYLSVIIPCYNSAEYMHVSIESALVGGEDVEILIVDRQKTIHTKLQSSMRKSILQLSERLHRKIKAMVAQLIQVLPMQPENISRFLTVMTGWMNIAFCIY